LGLALVYALRRKILEVDKCASTDDRIYEVHPEVSFAAMNGEPLAYPKKSWHGQPARLHLLANAGITIPEDLGPVGSIPPDDIIDASAAAWSAMRIASGAAKRVGEPVTSVQPSEQAGYIWF